MPFFFTPSHPLKEHISFIKPSEFLRQSLRYISPKEHISFIKPPECLRQPLRYIYPFIVNAIIKLFLNLVLRINRALMELKMIQNYCSVCEVYFLTKYRLEKHRKESGHKGTNGRPSKKNK